MSRLLNSVYCAQHSQQLVVVFCNTCIKPICTECLVDPSHRGHEFCHLIQAPELIREQLNKASKILDSQKTLIENEKRTSDAQLLSIQGGVEDLVCKVLKSTKEVYQLILNFQKSLTDLETSAVVNLLAGSIASLQEPSTDLQKEHLRLLEIRQSQRTLSQLLSLQNNPDLFKQ